MKSFYLSLIILCLTASAFGQSKFGSATKEELEMTSYPADTAASAVILLNQGKTVFSYNSQSGFQFKTTMQVKIKILKPEGLDRCNQSIAYYYDNFTSKEEIKDLSGTTYNLEDGKIVKTKFNKKNISKENITDKWNLIKFTMPAAKVGSVIEYKYTLVSDYFSELRNFVLQDSEPVVFASYSIEIPEFFVFSLNKTYYEPIQQTQKSKRVTFSINTVEAGLKSRTATISCGAVEYTFSAKNLPALRDEKYVWNETDYRTKLSFELQSSHIPGNKEKFYTTSWEQVSAQLYKSKYFGENLKNESWFANDIQKGDLSLSKATFILNYIRNKVAWNGLFGAETNNLRKALTQGQGSSAEVNFLLINALKAGGFETYPVALSTRRKGRLPVHPTIDAFNHVIAAIKINGSLYLADATDGYSSWNILPERCLVEEARVFLDETTSMFIDISKISRGSNFITAQYSATDSHFVLNVKEQKKGYTAYQFKKFYSTLNGTDQYQELLSTHMPMGEVSNVKVENTNNGDVSVSYTINDDSFQDNDILFITPLIDNPFPDNPFKAEKRSYPVNFSYLTDYNQTVSIDVPPGYAIDELPGSVQNVFGNDNDIIFKYHIIDNGSNKITLQYKYCLNRLVFSPAEYTELRDFFAKLVKKNTEQIVLKRIK